jgi:hypothetical protein
MSMNRAHVVVLDRSGYDLFRYPDGTPYLDPNRYRVTLVTMPSKVDQVRPGEVETVHAVDVLDERAVMAVLPDLSRAPAVDHVVAISERLLVLASRFRDRLGVAGFTEDQITTLRDKTLMKRRIGACGVRVPHFVEVSRPIDAADLLARYGSVILKPVDSMGSVGVHHVRSLAELRALDATGFAHAGRYEAEEYIAGDMFHIDSIVTAGRPVVALPSRYLDSNEHFVLGGQNFSTLVDPGPLHELLLRFNRQVLGALPWFSGVTHLEAFVDGSGTAVLCEVAGRPGGGGIVPVFAHRFGIDGNLAAVLPQLGLPMPTPYERQPHDRRATGTGVFYPPRTGTLRSPVPTLADDWIVKFTALKKPGDALVQPVSVGQGFAEVTVCGPDSAAIRHRLDAVKARLTLQIAPSSDGADWSEGARRAS